MPQRYRTREPVAGSLSILAVLLSFGCGGAESFPNANVVAVVSRVEVTPPSLALLVNESQQVNAVGYDANGNPVGGKPVSFSTDNAIVATVSASGLVTAIAAGSATITASIDLKSASVPVTVTRAPSTAVVDRVTLAPPSLALTVGQTAPLAATTLDVQGRTLSGKPITFSTDKASIASVSAAGQVTALAPGTATITASSEGKSATASVTVTAVPVSGGGIDVIPSTTYQTMLGWEATSQTGEGDPNCGGFTAAIPNYGQTLFNRAIDELGISRIRLEIRSGVENPTAAGETSYSAMNDNADPNVINAAGFQWGAFDAEVDLRVVPFRQALQARGQQLYVVLTYVDFNRNSSWEHARDTPEYAEFILAAFQHLQTKYGFVPDAVEIALEPANDNIFSALTLANALVATGDRLKAAGYRPAFIAPSTSQAAIAPVWFDRMVTVPRVFEYLTDLAYHRYDLAPDVRPIGARAAQYHLRTSMNEHIGSGYVDLHEDLTVANVSSWQQYTLAFCRLVDDGSFYYWIDRTNPSNVQLKLSARAKFLRQYFKFIRPGAVRVEATSTNKPLLDPVAFRNPTGNFVVVVKATGAGAFTVRGLPAGQYGIKYTTAAQYDVDAPDVTIAAGGTVTASIPATGAITIYGR